MTNNDGTNLRAPTRTRTLKSGAVCDMDTGRIVAMDPTRNPHAITKETSQLMHRRRAELRLAAEQAAREGIARAGAKANYGKKPTLRAALSTLSESLSRAVIDDNNALQGRARAYEVVLKAAGLLSDGRSERDNERSDTTVNVLAVDAEGLRELRSLYRRLSDALPGDDND